MANRRRLSTVPRAAPKSDVLDHAREVIRAEAEAVAQLAGRLNGHFTRAVDMVLEIGPVPEACPLGLAPTASTVALLAMGDALAMAVQHRRGFSTEQFASLHPGGALGKQLLRVRDVMRTGARNPTVRWDASLRETAGVMTRTEGRPGAASVVDAEGKLIGIFTDGDLRRLVQCGEVDFTRPVSAVMGTSPRVVGPDDLAIVAAEMLRGIQVDQLPVVDADGRPVGLLDIQDLLAARLLG